MNGQIDTLEEPGPLAPAESISDTVRNSEELSLIDILTVLASRKSKIVKFTGAALLAGIVVCIAWPVKYAATTKIMPPQQTQSAASMMMSQLTALGGSSLAAMASGGGIGLKNPNDIYIGLIQSRTISDDIVQEFHLQDVYRAKDMTGAREKLADNTEVRSEKSGLISISVTDRDKNRASSMANAYTDDLRKLTKEIAVTEASQRRLYYEDQLKVTREKLVEAQAAFEQVQLKNGLIHLDAQAKAMIESLTTLRAQVGAKEVELQALQSYSTEQNPQVQLAEKELASLKEEEAQIEQRSSGTEIAGLGLKGVPSAAIEYLRAQHELQYQQSLFDILMRQYDAARLDESKDAAIIQIVEPAIVPDRKYSPHYSWILVIAVLLGIVVSFVYIWLELALERNPDLSMRLRSLKSACVGH
jgi:tyrosine-protein kinase Etk/Wzc